MRTRSSDDGIDSSVDASRPPPANLKRRGFLLALSAGSASAAALAASAIPGVAAVNPTASPPEPSSDSAGYRETQHVRDYYRTAKV